jgi:hypothetical protein
MKKKKTRKKNDQNTKRKNERTNSSAKKTLSPSHRLIKRDGQKEEATQLSCMDFKERETEIGKETTAATTHSLHFPSLIFFLARMCSSAVCLQ